jgi:hypothetical protein
MQLFKRKQENVAYMFILCPLKLISPPCIIFFTFQHPAVCKQPLPEERVGNALEILNSSIGNPAGVSALHFTALTLCPPRSVQH